MNPLQRRSLFAILSLAESAIQQAKSLLALESGPSEPLVNGKKSESPQPGNPEYLSENEEEMFEKMLETDRMRLLEDEERRMKELWGSDE